MPTGAVPFDCRCCPLSPKYSCVFTCLRARRPVHWLAVLCVPLCRTRARLLAVRAARPTVPQHRKRPTCKHELCRKIGEVLWRHATAAIGYVIQLELLPGRRLGHAELAQLGETTWSPLRLRWMAVVRLNDGARHQLQSLAIHQLPPKPACHGVSFSKFIP
jgi:hypothetical protein